MLMRPGAHRRARDSSALDDELARRDAHVRRPIARDDCRPIRARLGRSRAGARSAPGTRCSRARQARSVAQRHVPRRGARLPAIADMGFDVVYLPPIHPIGTSFRKGRNNTLRRAAGRSRQPVGDRLGGGRPHGDRARRSARSTTSTRFVEEAERLGLEVALDLAFQCSPDHPWVREHPEWFRHRPDGTIKYAENPPKKYQDIYPFDFECDDWRGALAGAARRSRCSGSSTACASSASTTRTPSRSASGSG